MASRFVKTAVTVLLGFVLACQSVFLASANAVANAGAKKSHCCCSSKNCSTPACCAKRNQDQVPGAPASPPPTCQNELQALAAPVASTPVLPPRSTEELFTHVASSFSVRAIPLFQRDCSYLI
jgi:hypothetical protein